MKEVAKFSGVKDEQVKKVSVEKGSVVIKMRIFSDVKESGDDED